MGMTIYKEKKICCAHQLNLPYESKCNRLHGHNYRIEIWLQHSGNALNKNGMILDFADISSFIDSFDHIDLRSKMIDPSTAEKFAQFLANGIKAICQNQEMDCDVRVRVWETDTSYAEAEFD